VTSRDGGGGDGGVGGDGGRADAVQGRVDAHGDAVVAAVVADAERELAACRGLDGDEPVLDPFERAVLERLASRIAERTLPDVGATADAGAPDATVAATVAALFPEG
jgi:hypothetical protein